jgi:hypothetical protein
MIGVFFFCVADSSQTRTVRALLNRLTNSPKKQPIMYSTLLLSRRERAGSALVLAAVTPVAACNTEKSLTPTEGHIPTSPVLAKGANGGAGGGVGGVGRTRFGPLWTKSQGTVWAEQFSS